MKRLWYTHLVILIVAVLMLAGGVSPANAAGEWYAEYFLPVPT